MLVVVTLAATGNALAQTWAYASPMQTPYIIKIDASKGISGEQVADLGPFYSVTGTSVGDKYYMQVNDENYDSFWGYYDFNAKAFVSIGAIGYSDELRDMTYDAGTDRIFGAKSSVIYTVDKATGAKTKWYDAGSWSVIYSGIAATSDGTIYAVKGGNAPELHAIGSDGTLKSTTALTLPDGYSGIDGYSSLAADQNDELYYSLKCKTPESGTGFNVMLAKIDKATATMTIVGTPIAESNSRVGLSFADFNTGGTDPVEPEKAIRIKTELTYGDAMVSSDSPTKRTDYFYGPDDQLLRTINYQTSNGNLDPYTYTKHVYTDKEDGAYSVYSITRKKVAGGGSFSDTDRYWQTYLASTAEEKIFNADGKLAEHLTNTYNTRYTYDGDNLIEENLVYSDNASATLAGTAYKRIIYSDFAEGLKNCPKKSITASKTLSSVYWTEFEYDANGNKIAATIFKTTGAVKGDDGLYLEGAEKGVEYHKDVWTYDDQNRLTEHIYYSKWDAANNTWVANMSNKRDSLGYSGDTIVKQSYTGDPYGKDINVWMKNSTYTKTVSAEYDGSVALANFAVTEDAAVAGNFILTADAPAVNMNKSYRIYRDAAYIGDMTPDTESGKMTFTDKGIANGVHDWFVQTVDDATNEGLNISDAIEIVVAKDLAPAGNIQVTQNEIVDGKYQITVEWTKPETDGATVQSYNFYANVLDINKAIPQNTTPIKTTTYSFQWSVDGISQANKEQSFWIETVYDLGKVKSEEQKVTLNVMDEVNSIAEARQLANGTMVRVNLKDAKVTAMENTGLFTMNFIEDASGAMMVDQSIVDALPNAFTGRGVSITGSIFGTFSNSAGFTGIAANNFTPTSYIDYGEEDKLIPGEVTPTAMTINEACAEANMFRYVSFENSTLTVDTDGSTIHVELNGESMNVLDIFNKLPRNDNSELIDLGKQNFVNGIIYFDDELYCICPMEVEKADEPLPVEETRQWDFTVWSEQTKTNLAAEAAEVEIGAAETLWRSYEKVAGPSETEPDRGGACYWYGTAITEPTEMTANGVVIAEMAGLMLSNTGAGVPAIAINYPQTALGTYAGPSYLWLNGKNASFVIPNVKPGHKIVMDVESHKNSDARGVKLSVNGVEFGQGIPTLMESFSWTVPESYDTPAVDVVVTTTSGCHIYKIAVGTDVETGITSVNDVNLINSNVYNLNGTMVRKAGQTTDGLAKGVYIVGGKKVVVK